MAKTATQLNSEIDKILKKRRARDHHAAVATAVPHVEAINEAIYRSHDPDELIAAVSAAKKHVAAMRRVGSGHVDASGAFDPALYELMNLLVKANEMVRRIKIKRKTGRFPKPSPRTAWKLS
jgi:phosphoenolpyruvate carboxylase